jgi:CHRD domain
MKQLPIVTALVLAFAAPAALSDGGSSTLRVKLSGFQEIPTLSSAGAAQFKARVRGAPGATDRRIEWELSYNNNFSSPVAQAHIHFGARAFNGGISIFLCTNNMNGPAGTQTCPVGPITISGTATAALVLGPTAQGIAAGELEEVIAAIRAGAAYVNIHTATFPAGEIRGQFDDSPDRGHGHDDDDDD